MAFIDHFSTLEDTRSHINKKHNLFDVIFLTIVAILSGAEGWKDIKQFGDNKLDWLRNFRQFEAGIPVDDTIARIISALEPELLMSCFISWVNEIRQDNGQEVIAFDGKTLRHSFDGDRKTAIHSVCAYATEQGLVLAQSKSLSKKNEVSTVLELIELLELKGSVITADAMHCLKKTAKAITKKGGDYALQVKNNQGKLAREIKAYFHKVRRDEPELIESNRLELTNDGHGRIEHRSHVQLPVNDWLEQRKGWDKLTSVIEVTRTRYIGDKESVEVSYYISSLDIDLPQIARVIRKHWAIENSAHWVLDVVFKEDDSRIRRGDAPENMATFRRFAMNLARASTIKDSIKGKLKQAAWSDEVREKLLFG